MYNLGKWPRNRLRSRHSDHEQMFICSFIMCLHTCACRSLPLCLWSSLHTPPHTHAELGLLRSILLQPTEQVATYVWLLYVWCLQQFLQWANVPGGPKMLVTPVLSHDEHQGNMLLPCFSLQPNYPDLLAIKTEFPV